MLEPGSLDGVSAKNGTRLIAMYSATSVHCNEEINPTFQQSVGGKFMTKAI
jgi:hypothetical protein